MLALLTFSSVKYSQALIPTPGGTLKGEVVVYPDNTAVANLKYDFNGEISPSDNLEYLEVHGFLNSDTIDNQLVLDGFLNLSVVSKKSPEFTGSLLISANWNIENNTGNANVNMSFTEFGPIKSGLAIIHALIDGKYTTLNVSADFSLYKKEMREKDLQQLRGILLIMNNASMLNAMIHSYFEEALYAKSSSATFSETNDLFNFKVWIVLQIENEAFLEKLREMSKASPSTPVSITPMNVTLSGQGTFELSLNISETDGKTAADLYTELHCTSSGNITEASVKQWKSLEKEIPDYVPVLNDTTIIVDGIYDSKQAQFKAKVDHLTLVPTKKDAKPEILISHLEDLIAQLIKTQFPLKIQIKIYKLVDHEKIILREFYYTPESEKKLALVKSQIKTGISTVLDSYEKVEVRVENKPLVKIEYEGFNKTLIIVKEKSKEQFKDLKHYVLSPVVEMQSTEKGRVKITMYYDPKEVEKLGISPEYLTLAKWKDGTWIEVPSEVDTKNCCVSAYVEEFSIWGIVTTIPTTTTTTTTTPTETTPTTPATETTPTVTKTTPSVTETTTETTPTPQPPGPPSIGLIAIIAVAIVVVIASTMFFMRKRAQQT